MPKKVEISHRTIIFTFLLIGGVFLVYYIRDIILQLFVSLLLMTILQPLVDKLTKMRIPRVLSVVITYLLVLGTFGGALALLVPPLITQTGSFINTLLSHVGNLGIAPFDEGGAFGSVISALGGVPSEILKFTLSVFSNIFAVGTVLVFTFYLLLSRERFEDHLGLLFGQRRQKIGEAIDTLEDRLGGWARGQLTLMLIVGIAVYIGLLLVGVPFALPLAILAGLFEIIPYLGPLIAAIPAVIIGFGASPITGIGAAAIIFLVQQLENTVLVPKIMEKSVGISPIIVLLSLAIGGRLAGITGAVISIPVVIMLQVLSEKFFMEGSKPDSV